MKAVLMSIHPQWCQKIFSGEKTIEVRRNRPKLEPPFTVYVYCTKAKNIREDGLYLLPNDKELHLGCKENDLGFVCWEGDFRNGKVIGSFVCDKVEEIMVKADCATTNGEHWKLLKIAKEACLSKQKLKDYIRVGESGYGWHISDLKIYDKPKELSEFYTLGNCEKYDFCNQCKNFHRGQGWLDGSYCDEDSCLDNTRIPVTRAPKSWQYVEEL